MDMRGLANFITDIRRATNDRDEELKRVEQELAKIRAKFKNSDKLTPYERKKYVCKLLFIFILGYNVDFGHMECVHLLSGASSSEKLIGYLGITVLLHENHEVLTLTTHTVGLDLRSDIELHQCLALTAIANVGGRDFAEAMAQSVQRLVIDRDTSPAVRKKAMLTLLRMYRKYKEVVHVEEVAERAAAYIANDHFGVANCAISLVNGLLADPSHLQYFHDVPALTIRLLSKVILEKVTAAEYIHYGVPAPWLQLKALHLLQNFSFPAEVALQEKITLILSKIVNATERLLRESSAHAKEKGFQSRCNAMNAVVVEALSLAMAWDNDPELLTLGGSILNRYINDRREPNLRYLGLSLLARLSFCRGAAVFQDYMSKHQRDVIGALHDPDPSISKKALDLLYCMCDNNNASEVVGELLEFLPAADSAVREDLVLMTAVLTEKFCSDYAWYVEVIFQLLAHGGAEVSSYIWQRLCQIVVNVPTVQKHAAESAFRAASAPDAHDVVVSTAAFILGEFGYQIAKTPEHAPLAQFNMLHARFHVVTTATQVHLLSAYAKFYNLYDNPTLRDRVKKVLGSLRSSLDLEVQTRACEYLELITTVSDEVLQKALELMPPFQIEANTVSKILRDRQKGTDRNVWLERLEARDVEHVVSKPLAEPATAAAAQLAAQVEDLSVHRASSDLIDMQYADAPAPAAVKIPEKPPVETSIDDLFAPTVTRRPDTKAEVSQAAFHKLIEETAGTLFKSEAMEIAVQQEIRGADMRVTLRCRNTSTATIDRFSLAPVQVPAQLMLQSRQHDTSIPAGASIDVQFAARGLAPFEGHPQLQLTFHLGGASTVTTVPMPIVTTKFIDPYKLDDTVKFFAFWNTQPAVNSTGPQRIVASTAALASAVDIVTIEAFVLQKLRMFTMRHNQSVLCGCGAHAVHSGATPEFSPVMLTVEITATPGEFVATCKSPAVAVAHALVEIIRRHWTS